MSLMNYLAQKTSSTLEKTICSLSTALFLLFAINWLFDLLRNESIIASFSLEEVFSSGFIQIELIIIFLLVSGFIYLVEPFEKLTQNRLSRFYSTFLLTQEDYDQCPELKSVLKRPLYRKHYNRMYEEVLPLKDTYLVFIGFQYLAFALTMALAFTSLYALKYWFFDLSQTTDLYSLTDRIFIGTLFIILLLFCAVVYLFGRKIPDKYQTLKRRGLLVSHAYILYHNIETQEYLSLVKNGSWTEIRRAIYTAIQNWIQQPWDPKNMTHETLFHAYDELNKNELNFYSSWENKYRDQARMWHNLYSGPNCVKKFIKELIFSFSKALGILTCPPYHLAITKLLNFYLTLPNDIKNDYNEFNRYSDPFNNCLRQIPGASRIELDTLMMEQIVEKSEFFSNYSNHTLNKIQFSDVQD